MRRDDRRDIWQKARASGERFYFTGIACHRGHVAKRYAANRCCSECVDLHNKKNRTYSMEELSAGRKRSLAERHAKLAQGTRRGRPTFGTLPRDKNGWLKVILRSAAKRKGLDRYFTGKPCIRGHIAERSVATKTCAECSKLRYEVNREKSLADSVSHYAANREKTKLRVKNYARDNPDRVFEWVRNRRARLAFAVGTLRAQDVKKIRAMQKDRCAYCRIRLNGAGHADHIIPLARGGSNEPTNIQILCVPCNSKKGARDPIQFARSQGMLL